jgi:hypothetical protein
MLTNEEKIGILSNHQKNLYYTQYGFQVNLIEENSKVEPNTDAVKILQNQIADCTRQIAALDQEISSLTNTN